MDKFFKAVGVFFTGLIFVLLLAVLGAYPTKWAVNYLFTAATLTTLFGGPLTFWKALVLNYIGGALFKGTTTVSK